MPGCRKHEGQRPERSVELHSKTPPCHEQGRAEEQADEDNAERCGDRREHGQIFKETEVGCFYTAYGVTRTTAPPDMLKRRLSNRESWPALTKEARIAPGFISRFYSAAS
jgi:hypothetical protein